MRFFFACEIGERGDCFHFPSWVILKHFLGTELLHLSLIFFVDYAATVAFLFFLQ
jgi:hypothetical protein